MGCRAQNLKFRAQNFDLHRSDPQRSGTPDLCVRTKFNYSVIMTPSLTPNKFWEFNKRNFQERLHHSVFSLLGKLHNLLHTNILRELIGVMIFTSVTPENSWGINCVVLEGPMVLQKAAL